MSDPLFCTWEGWRGQIPGQAAVPSDGTASQAPFKALLGWKGMIVWDASIDPVDLLRAYLEKVRQESCGQCSPCREGTERLCVLMDRICTGRARSAELDEIVSLAGFISATARCDVGMGLARPTSEIIDRYRELFESTVHDKRIVPRGNFESVVTAPCMSACPSNVDIPAYVEGVRMDRFGEALDTVRHDCPMPGTIGRVCVRPCERSCRRGVLDRPIAIRALKRFLADHEIRHNLLPPVQPAAPKPERVAVVGAGPAGLACAYNLGLLGYRTTIFEAQEKAGGMASFGIPSYRLPREIIAYEVELVEKLGAQIRYGLRVGQDVSLEQLAQEGYRAIFLAMGAPESSKMRCEGEEAGYHCFMTGIHFLAEVARGRRPVEGNKLVVVGGGNVAMDCVRSALRIGFSDVNLLYRRTEAEMPADPQEVLEAKEEGVKMHYLIAPLRIIENQGKVAGLECQRMSLGEPDRTGRRRPVAVKGSEFVIDCDVIIPAVGQICVVDCVLPAGDDITAWKTLVVNQMTFQTRTPTVFGGGDCVTGPATLIAALAAGKKAARHIVQYIEQGTCQPTAAEVLQTLVNQSGVFDPDEKFAYPGINHRAEPVIMEAEERIKGFDEVEGCLDPHQAYAEANRCLRCYKIAVAAL